MIKKSLIKLIGVYSYLVSPLLGKNCRFYPSCSAYMQQAIEKHGIAKGVVMGTIRLCRCHPWHQAEINDPVPDSIAWRQLIGYKRKHSGKIREK